MEELAFFCLIGGSAAVLLAGFMQTSGYLQLPCLTAAVFLGWVIPQLWRIRQEWPTSADGTLTLMYMFCLACLFVVVVGWRQGKRSVRRVPRRYQLTDEELTKICTAITIFAWLMRIGMGTRPLEERSSSTWSGPLTIMYFFFNLKVISLYISTYLLLKKKNSYNISLFLANSILYIPLVFLLFRRRAMFEVFTCSTLAIWFARGKVVPRIVVLSAMPIGMLVVFAIGILRAMTIHYNGTASWISLADLSSVDFWAATPFENSHNAPEMTNALNLMQFSNDFGVHTFGATSWNRVVFQWVPAQLLGADFKQALMLNVNVSQRVMTLYNDDVRIGATPTAMGEAYLEFGVFGVLFFFVMAFLMGRWWMRANAGSLSAMTLYSSGLAVAVLMPTAYAIYFFNVMLLYGSAFHILSKVFSSSSRQVRSGPRIGRRRQLPSRSWY